MIIGKGMIASAFKEYINSECIIFASGVSNSLEIDISQFEREEKLLKKTVNLKKKIVYFSSTAVLLDKKHYSPYLNHKLKMETHLKDHDHIIMRLPQIVGPQQNQKNLIPFIYNSIKNDIPFYIQKDTYRNLIDIQDVVKFTKFIIRAKNLKTNTINFLNFNFIKVEEIVKIFQDILKKNGNYQFIKSKYIKDKVSIRNDIAKLIIKSGVRFNSEYNKNLLIKYYDK